MIRFLPLSALCCLVFACAPTPPVEEVEPDHGAGSVIRLAPELDAIVPADYTIEKLDDGFVFIEGPVWVEDPGYLLFSDVRGDTIYKWAPGAKSEPFLTPVYTGPPPEEPRGIGPNGLTVDGEGNLIISEHGNRRIARMPLAGGDRETLADKFEGKRINSPNDLVYHSSGALYFTDPKNKALSFPPRSPRSPLRSFTSNPRGRAQGFLFKKERPFASNTPRTGCCTVGMGRWKRFRVRTSGPLPSP